MLAKVLELFPLYGKSLKETKDASLRGILVSRYRPIYGIYSENEVNILSVHH